MVQLREDIIGSDFVLLPFYFVFLDAGIKSQKRIRCFLTVVSPYSGPFFIPSLSFYITCDEAVLIEQRSNRI
jgi:hypothetical protein